MKMKKSSSILFLTFFYALASVSAEEKKADEKVKSTAYVMSACNVQMPVTGQLPVTGNDPQSTCNSLFLVSKNLNAQAPTVSDSYKSVDDKVKCNQAAGYTLDYKHCKKVVQLYNYVVAAEQALNVQQTISTQNLNQKLQGETTVRAAQGDLQGGAIDATIKSNQDLKEKKQQLAAAYSTAVAAFSGALMSWPTDKSVKKNCPDEVCRTAIDKSLAVAKPEVFANDQAKAFFLKTAGDYGVKALKATRDARKLGDIAGKMEQAKQTDLSDGQDVQFNRCLLNAQDPTCKGPGNRVEGQVYQAGDFSVGDGGVSNAFNSGSTNDSSFGDPGATGSSDEGQKIADINSPFVDQAKEASGILNPAPGANSQAGGGGAGAGGGGGGMSGGLGGGGGVSLGDDLEGAQNDDKKDPSIKANSISSATTGGGKGFSGIAKSKDEANPFANLFDAKSEGGGGVEEDRSIASDDKAEGSGLFQKISRRYGQVQADKRIEANNLE
ncbi:MAG: hypothetical protein AB7I27_17865 [Bacteriovoracaceae bacterium]